MPAAEVRPKEGLAEGNLKLHRCWAGQNLTLPKPEAGTEDSMTTDELMALARRAIEAALADRDLEDSRVELKSQWPEPSDLARQLAAMANSRGQQELVWLIGIRRGRGAVGATNQDGSVWLPTVRSEFDEGVMPALVQHENLDVDGSNVVALVWDPRDLPYLVKAPAGRGFEVLWREGESIRPMDGRDDETTLTWT